MILATDLDGTFLGGSNQHKQQLYELIRNDRSICLVFVTGRGLESVESVLADPIIPAPDYIICDVGATIVNGYTKVPIQPIQYEIEMAWPGTELVREQLAGMPGLTYQEVPQHRRCSFFMEDENLLNAVKKRLTGLECDVVFSGGKFLDILPRAVNKGTTLVKLVAHLEADGSEVLVAGDTMNDHALYVCGYKGVVVGGAEQKLVNLAAVLEKVFVANEGGAGGILEAFHHFDDLERYREGMA
jgi:sucrose-6F-phosphate phosphohydrolase